MKVLFRLFVRFVIVLVVLSALSLGYLHFYGFPGFLKDALVAELRKAGYEAQFGSIRLDLFRGIVATDASFADARAPKQPLAQIDELELRFNLRRLIHKQNPIRGIHIANAVIAVPTPPDENGPAKFTASGAYATFKLADDGSVHVDGLTGVYCGIRLNVSGYILHGAAPSPTPAPSVPPAPPAPPPPASQGQFLFLTKAVRELNRIQVTTPPDLNLNFNIDLSQPLASQVVARFHGEHLQYHDLLVDSVAVDVEMREGAIVVRHCDATLYGGDVSVQGRYDVAMGQFDLSFSSTTDPATIIPLFIENAKPILRDLRVEKNPTITAHYRLGPDTGSLPVLTGTVEAPDITFKGVEFRSIKFAYEDRGPQVRLNDVEVVTPEGRATGHGEYNIESSDFTYEFDSTVDPTRLLPLMSGKVREIVEPAWFQTPPHIVASVSGDFVDPDALAYDAQVTADRCSYRGVGLEAASARLHLKKSQLDTQDLVLRRREGDARGTIFADFNAHRVSFNITATANVSDMAGLLGEPAARIMRPYRFGPRTEASARGLVDFDNPYGTAWSATVTNEGFAYWKFTATRAQADLVFTNNSLQINNFDADFYGGKLLGHADFTFSRADPTYAFDFSVDSADVNGVLSAAHGRPSTVTGLLTGKATINGRGADMEALTGRGELSVSDGVLWQAPVFGIFSQVLGNTKATRATASFAIANRAVSTDDMQVSAGVFTARSWGQLGFDGKMDFRVQAQFLKSWPGVGLLTWPLAKILEYKVGGTISDPTYRPVNFPKELLPSK
ncbi:MAG TPA: AsmA-like C-terminal region-containing protein [Verrucomicrobiae bacterium]|nr:AsmA-like C-terminal region-containing protein [Verrucomicrobiae bacterium]